MRETSIKILEDGNRCPGIIQEKDGVHFGYYASTGEAPVLLLYKKGTQEVAKELPFPASPLGDRYYSMKVKLNTEEFEYNFREGETIITDPYARRLCGRGQFGEIPSENPHALRSGFTAANYRWGEDRLPALAYEETVMYHLHVRGFTMQKNSGVRKKGTFAGIREKILYFKKLGVNSLRLMPVYEFDELTPRFPRRAAPQTQQEAQARAFEKIAAGTGQMPEGTGAAGAGKMPEGIGAAVAGQMPEGIGAPVVGQMPQTGDAPADAYRMNFWGYGPGRYFAPKSAYSASGRPDVEFKDMVKALHAEDIEVILEFSFADDTDFAVIADCLSYWAAEYHVDGFAVIARESVVAELARLPLFQTRKLLCNWYPDDVRRRNAEKAHALLAESNDSFLYDCRKLLKGDEGCLEAFSYQLRSHPKSCAKINYMTNHDGFTLLDLVSYDHKHNMENGENDRDGTDYNCSWNCGAEGPSGKKAIAALRMRQRKNAYAMMLFSQGTPMLLAGDEFGNSQSGNNNPYCHDSELSWVDWSGTRRQKELTEFVQKAIAYRKAHRVLHQDKEPSLADMHSSGYPDLSFHGDRAWYGDFLRANRHLGCMYSGYYTGEEGFVYIAYNFHWNPQQFALPLLKKGQAWYKVMDTSLKESFIEDEALGDVKAFTVPSRTVVILEGK